MNGGPTIVDLRTGRIAAAHAIAASDDLAISSAGAEPEFVDRSAWADRGGAIVAGVAAAFWIGIAAWIAWPTLRAGADAATLLALAGGIAAPLALIALIHILMQRSGAAEGARFERSAARMRSEAARLDAVVAALAERLDASRSELRDQADRLVAQGDAAAERLAAISNGIAHELAAIDAHTHKLIQGSSAARADMTVLMTGLPGATQSARDLAAGLRDVSEAATHASISLEERLSTLAMRGRNVGEAATTASDRLAGELARIESGTDAAAGRLDTATTQMTVALDEALGRTAGAIEQSGKALSQQGEAIAATLHAGGATLAHAGAAAVDQLAERIGALEMTIDDIAGRLLTQQQAGAALVAGLARDIDATEARLAQLDETGAQRTERLAGSIATLRDRAEAMTQTLATGEVQATGLLDRAEALLTALDANAREIDETLPRALGRLDGQLSEVRSALGPVSAEVEALVAPSERARAAAAALAELLDGHGQRMLETDVAASAHLANARMESERLSQLVEELTQRAEGFADSAAPRLVEALLRVRDTASQASEHARNALAEVIPQAAQGLAEAGSSALNAAVGDIIRIRIAELAQASEDALGAANAASTRLMRQMMTIAETTAQVEQRFAQAQAEREAHEEESFARRVSLLLESLNSASIDVTRIISAEVADTAWAAYLKGDRGIFTRRAVELLDQQQAKQIARLYDENPELRAMVNRYIHDFEGMLRVVLASREGSTLGVTLLSSDMGKLYVAIAQAIERLRI